MLLLKGTPGPPPLPPAALYTSLTRWRAALLPSPPPPTSVFTAPAFLSFLPSFSNYLSGASRVLGGPVKTLGLISHSLLSPLPRRARFSACPARPVQAPLSPLEKGPLCLAPWNLTPSPGSPSSRDLEGNLAGPATPLSRPLLPSPLPSLRHLFKCWVEEESAFTAW